jgi:hypothetical protein
MASAQMLPYPVQVFRTPTEELVYRELEAQLSSQYTVLYGRSWVDDQGGAQQDIECDFIVAKLDGGILVLEVKGGVWERHRGFWYANRERVKPEDDPFSQAESYWKNRFFPMDYAVGLPETRFEAQSDFGGLPSVLTHRELPYIGEWLEQVMNECVRNARGARCTQEMIEHLVHSVMRDYTVRLGDILVTDEKRLLVLTEQQLQLDQSLARKRRLTVQGCAGSGKTLMALKQAKRLSHVPEVRRILLTCFNRELGQWLKSHTQDIRHKCDTVPFLDFCEEQARNAGLLTGRETKDQYYYDQLPELLFEALEKPELRYDAIIVDEGQIFRPDWWAVIESLLKDAKKSYFYVFYDEFQRIYKEMNNRVPGDDDPIDLTVNVRNTAHIHRQATAFLQKDLLPRCNGVEGESVWIGLYDNPRQMKEMLRETLTLLISEGHVSSKDVIILTTRALDKSAVQEGNLGPFHLLPIEVDNPASIRFATVQAFRGMERQVVILTEIDGAPEDMEPLIYLGASRARTKLVLLASRSLETPFMAVLSRDCESLDR